MRFPNFFGIQAAVRGGGGGGNGGLATSYSDSSISSNKRKRVEFDATQVVVIGGVKVDGRSKSCRDMRDVAPDPDPEFRVSYRKENIKIDG